MAGTGCRCGCLGEDIVSHAPWSWHRGAAVVGMGTQGRKKPPNHGSVWRTQLLLPCTPAQAASSDCATPRSRRGDPESRESSEPHGGSSPGCQLRFSLWGRGQGNLGAARPTRAPGCGRDVTTSQQDAGLSWGPRSAQGHGPWLGSPQRPGFDPSAPKARLAFVEGTQVASSPWPRRILDMKDFTSLEKEKLSRSY